MADQKQQPHKPKPQRPRGRGGRGRGKGRGPPNRGDQKKFQAPVAQTNVNRTRKPKVQTLVNGDCRITHREYVEDIVAAGGGPPTPFTAQALALNPGQKTTFQWLSRIAANYESYRFESLHFCYETEAATTLGGTLMLAIDYDAADPAPTSKQQAMAYRSSTRTAPWAGCRHRSMNEDLRKNKSNFVRIGAQPPNTDIKTYDIGNLFVISQGIGVSGATLGELYVEYTVLLMTPVYEPLYIGPFGGDFQSNGAPINGANPFGTAPVLNPLSQGVVLNNASQFTFTDVGTYLVTIESIGTVITAAAFVPDGNSAVAALILSLDSGALFINVTYAVVVNTAPSTVSYTVTATTITQSIGFVGSAPTGSI